MSDPRYRYCPVCGRELVRRHGASPETPRLECGAHDCGYVAYFNPVPVVAGIVETPSGVVLARSHGRPVDRYGLITGFLERAETPSQGILREVEEELGVHAQLLGRIGDYAFAARNQLILAFHLFTADGLTIGEELAEIKVVDVAKLRPWEFGTGPAVADWLAARRSVAVPGSGAGSTESWEQ